MAPGGGQSPRRKPTGLNIGLVPAFQIHASKSAAIVAYRLEGNQPAFLLVHPGGPFWRARDLGVWSLPKGMAEAGEDPQAAARREFREELGLTVVGTMQALTPRLAYRGKVILPWLAEAALDLSQFKSQTVRLAWPPRSGQFLDVPEVDQALYFPLPVALQKVLPAQAPILLEAADLLGRKNPHVAGQR